MSPGYVTGPSQGKENKTVPGKVARTHTRGWTQTGYLNKHYNINQKDEDT